MAVGRSSGGRGRRGRARAGSRRPATLHTVADAVGVSIQTVSNTLNAPHKVLPSTRERVEAEIAVQGYRPNSSARSLRTNRAGLLGLCVKPAQASGPIVDGFVHAVTEAAERAGYHVLLFSEDEREATDAYSDLLAKQAVDGFILSDTTVDDTRQDFLAKRGVPFAAFGRRWSEREVGSWVDVDGAAGVAAAVEHLALRGHRRVAFVGWPLGSGVGDDRCAGFQRSCRDAGLEVVDIVRGQNSVSEGAHLADELLARDGAPTAVVCVSDELAFGVDHAARRRGLRPGIDVAITGFDDSPAAALPALSLTTVRQPLEVAGERLVRLLANQITGSETVIERVLLQPSLVVRDSTAMQADRPLLFTAQVTNPERGT